MKHIALYIDLAFCIVVLPLMILCFPIERWFHNFTLYIILFVIWIYTVYVVNRRFTVRLLYHGGKSRRRGWILILLSLAGTYLFSTYELYPLRPSIFDVGFTPILPHVKQYQQAVWSLFLIVESFSFAVGLLVEADHQMERRRAVEGERDKAEIALYRAQIKPHFMFNTLNSLYGLFLTGSDRALPAHEKFISMTRYVHTTAVKDLVPLGQEVDYIGQYVGLQQLRLNDKTRVTMTVDIADPELPMPPLLLVTFIENCFKHGISPVEASHIRITVTERDGQLNFMTENHIFANRKTGDRTGVDNCRRRLNLLYPGRHTLLIDEDNNTYSVKLSIDLR